MAGNILKFDLSIDPDSYVNAHQIIPILDLKSPIIAISLDEQDVVLTVTTESKVAICHTDSATYVEAGMENDDETSSLVGSVVHRGNEQNKSLLLS